MCKDRLGNGASGMSGPSVRSPNSGTSGIIVCIPDNKKSSYSAKELCRKFSLEGLNNHELNALNADYIDVYFEYYLPLKLRLLENRINANGDNEKVYLNYLRVLTYTLFENSWFVFLMTGDHKFYFSKDEGCYVNPYHNHLPSFSSALLHIGSCFDQFFVLIRPFYVGRITDPRDFSEALKVNYRLSKNSTEYYSVLKFMSDNDPAYLQKGKEMLKSNRFRNYFAHQLRLLWWHRNGDTNLYYFPKDLYDKIMNSGSDGRQEVFNMLIDTKEYRDKIQASDVNSMISSKDIIINFHEEMTDIFNLTFKHILNRVQPEQESL
jgi:hypothetical protein